MDDFLSARVYKAFEKGEVLKLWERYPQIP